MTGAVVAVHGSRSDASPVLAEWFVAWNNGLGAGDCEALRLYAARLVGSRGSIDQEVTRQWLTIDWLIRLAAPTWLRGAHLFEHAERLGSGPVVVDRRSLTGVADVAEAASVAARDAHEAAWSTVAELVQPDASNSGRRPPWRPVPGSADPRRVTTWGGLADGTRAAIPPVGRLVGPACRATGYAPEGDDAPLAWRAASRAVADAAGIVAWIATRSVVTTPGWSWRAPVDDAWHIAQRRARSALEPVETTFVAAAYELVERMFRVTEDADGRVPPAGRGLS